MPGSTHAPAPRSAGGPASALPRRRQRLLTVVAVVALLGALLVVRATLVVPVSISSASMLPTFAAGDVVLTSRNAPELDEVQHGDLVVFTNPEDGERTLKRVLGLPGDALVIKDSVLYVNDRVVEEPYIDHAAIDAYYSRTYQVPPGTVFVLGDNRGNSIDSRDYGAIAAEDLLGRALFRLWPLVRRGGPQPSPPRT